MRRLRVVTLVDRLGRYGGAEQIALKTTIGLDPARFDRTLVVSRWGPRLAEESHVPETLADLHAAGVRFVGLERGSRLAVWDWTPFVRLLRRERVDVLHAHMFGSNVWATVLGGLARVPVIVAHEHTWSFEGRPLRRLIDREVIARFSDALLAVSTEDRRKMIEVEGIDPGDIVLVPNGIAVEGGPSGHDLRAELGIRPEAPVIGAMGHLRPQKALHVLVEAAATVAREFPDLGVVIAGDGVEAGRLERLAGQLGIADSLFLLGRRSDVWDILAALDVAVLSSDFEGSPLSVMEYMEAGRPVVATRVGCLPDLVEDGVTGRLVERRNAPELAAAIMELLRDPQLAREMGRRGRDRRRAQFDISATVSRLEELYERLWRKKVAGGG